MHLTIHKTFEISAFQGCFANVLINNGVSKGVVLKIGSLIKNILEF